MPVYHLSLKNGSPGAAAAHASYILREDRYADRDEDLRASESGNMPAWAAANPKEFWIAADTFERVNGRPYREMEVALPRELTDEQRIALVREFVSNTLGDRHAYTWSIHSPEASDGAEQPHVHIMFSERRIDGIDRDPQQYFRRWNAENPEKGGAGKDRYFASQSFVLDVRNEWAELANEHLERAGIDARIDARSYRDQGLNLEPQLKRGIAGHGESRGVLSEITRENRERAARNGERLIEAPELAIEALTARQSVFSRRDLQQFIFRNSDTKEQFEAVSLRVFQSPELVALQCVGGVERFTSRELHGIEQRLVTQAGELATKQGRGVVAPIRDQVEAGRAFNTGQREAYRLLVGSSALATVNGAAGTGKSYVLSAVREAYEQAGFKVVGATLQGKTADDLEREAGIRSSTLHRLLGQLDRGEMQLDARTVVVVDEAGLVGSRQLGQLFERVAKSGSQLRLVGDAYQLHAIDAGDAFGAVAAKVTAAGSSAALTEILRQRQDWQRAASAALSEHRIKDGVAAYRDRGFVTEFATQREAREGLLAQWKADCHANPQGSQLLLTHSNRERQALNTAVRSLRRDAGELGPDLPVQAATGRIELATGDRIVFLKNDYDLGVKNGSTGTLKSLSKARLSVQLDDGRTVNVDPKVYGHIDHGYALTIHKAQGVTVDRAYLMATSTMNAQLAYVGLTRHREDLRLVYSREQFADASDLDAKLSRVERKAFSADYAPVVFKPENETGKRETLADRRGLQPAVPVPEKAKSDDLASPQQVPTLPPASKREKHLASLWQVGVIELDRHVRKLKELPEIQPLDQHPALKEVRSTRAQMEFRSKWLQAELERLGGERHEFMKGNQLKTALHDLGALRTGRLVEIDTEIRAAKKEQGQVEKALEQLLKKVEPAARIKAQKDFDGHSTAREATQKLIALAEGVLSIRRGHDVARKGLDDIATARALKKPGLRDGDALWKSLTKADRNVIDRRISELKDLNRAPVEAKAAEKVREESARQNSRGPDFGR